MKKRIWASVLTLTMLLGLLPTAALAEEYVPDDAVIPYSEGGEAGSGSGTEESETGLPKAVDGVIKLESGDYTLSENVTASIVVPSSVTATLDLNGKTLTNANGKHTIENKGTLTVTDSSNGKGNVTNNAAGHAALANHPDAEATLKGGNYSNAQWYTIKNLGTLTIKDGTSFTTTDSGSSMIDTGWYGNKGNDLGLDYPTSATVSLTIDGGTFSGGMNTVKNDDFGETTINGGKFSNTVGPVILNWHKMTINDGEFKISDEIAKPLVANGYLDETADAGQFTIKGGTFTGKNSLFGYGEGSKNGGTLTVEAGTFTGGIPGTGLPYTLTVSGGTFSSDVSRYVAEGYAWNADTGMVGKFEAVAQIGEDLYPSLSAAVTAAKENDTIVLLKDITVRKGISVGSEKKITLDLGGHTLTRSGGLVLDIYGDVTIKNGIVKMTGVQGTAAIWLNGIAKLTVEKNATISVSETSADNCYAIALYEDCTAAELTVRGKLEGGSGVTVNGLVTDENVQNKLIVDGATIDAVNHGIYQAGNATTTFSVNNSTISGSTGIEVRAGNIEVNNSTITGNGAFSCVKNGGGTTTTGVGIAIAQHTTELPIDVKIVGGTISGTYSVYEANPQENDEESIKKVKLSITGGNFNGPVYSKDIIGFISGGNFTTDPTAYCAEGKVGVLTDRKDYPFTVGKAAETDVKPATGDPVVDVKEIEDKHQNDAKAVAESVKDTTGVLPAAANGVVNNVTQKEKDAATEEIKKDTSIVPPPPSTQPKINIYAQTYLDVKPKTYKTEDPSATDAPVTEISMDITPMYRVVASTAERAEDIKVKVKGETTGSDSANAIVYGDPQKLEIKTPMTISIELPKLFKVNESKVYVQHKGYEYTAEVTNGGSTGKTATFTNPHGFSLFTVTTVPAAVAKIGDTSYTTLQAAVDAVSDKGTIVLQKDNSETITVSRAVTFTLEKDSKTFNGKIEAGSGYTLSEKDGVYTITKQSSSSGGSSSGGSSGSSGYAVSVPGKVDHGTVTVSPKNASKGTTVTVTVKPDTGYQLKDLTVTDKNGNKLALTDKGNGKYTFTMPSGKVSVSASFEAIPTPVAPKTTYVDVPDGMWYTEAVAYVTDKGIMSGIGDQKFGPDVKLTRAMLMTMLARLDGVDTTGGSTWYEKGRAWAMEKGVSDGTDPEGTITREQLVSMLYRYAQYKGYDVSVGEDTNILSYADAQSISEWAMSAMQWACGAGVIHGTSDVTLSPLSSATRAEVAAMFLNYMEHVAK
ncbi:S-layer homology domain-containing protein [Pseudoflavonifractor sp. MSJ-37]|uniref:S-layer homology domain-containing protein n=1 Tax=Pseudoflavonifractor sp. MSJ-37 TaxID=2841531 RepID=UPI001C11BAAC|nr:S-layer homology domain-containing protein [Pseudoflavonifractor sp. MSJ-37]MBU5435765.1 S-layer homology domain-containing protein [Pseudoflavonifractor sp. MSJ-37]